MVSLSKGEIPWRALQANCLKMLAQHLLGAVANPLERRKGKKTDRQHKSLNNFVSKSSVRRTKTYIKVTHSQSVGRLKCFRLVKIVAELRSLCLVLIMFTASICPNHRGNQMASLTLSTHSGRRYLRTRRSGRKGPCSYSSLLFSHRGRRDEVAVYPEGPGTGRQVKRAKSSSICDGTRRQLSLRGCLV